MVDAAAVLQMVFGHLLWDVHACAAAVAFREAGSVAATLYVVVAAAAAARVSAELALPAAAVA